MTVMGRKSSGSGAVESGTAAVASFLEAAQGELIFIPTPLHRKVKAKFWAKYDGAFGGDISLSQAQNLTGEASLKKWWTTPGFKEWFSNTDEARERLEYLYMLAMDTAETILLDTEANANARVQMVKIIAQLAGKDPSISGRADSSDPIMKMTRAELRVYIEKHAPKLLAAMPVVSEKSDISE